MEQSSCVYCMSPSDGDVCPHCGRHRSEYVSAPHHLMPGTLLNNKYEVGAVLGEGGFGITYIGKDINLDLRVAIKEYFPSGVVNRNNTASMEITAHYGDSQTFFEKGKKNFLGEARTLAKFSNDQSIVSVRDFFSENNTTYIVMEYIEGIDLKDYLAQSGVMSFTQAFEMLSPIMTALTKMHAQGLIHRDISPANIMVMKDGTVKLLDFGAARNVGGADEKSLSILLKPGYAPEEQYRTKGNQGPWTDVYALSATLYKLVTGITPDDAMNRIFQDEIAKPSSVNGQITAEQDSVILKGMAVRQENRYQSVAELQGACQACLVQKIKRETDAMCCDHCGHRISEGSVFCTNCGKKLNFEEPEAENTVSKEPAVEDSAQEEPLKMTFDIDRTISIEQMYGFGGQELKPEQNSNTYDGGSAVPGDRNDQRIYPSGVSYTQAPNWSNQSAQTVQNTQAGAGQYQSAPSAQNTQAGVGQYQSAPTAQNTQAGVGQYQSAPTAQNTQAGVGQYQSAPTVQNTQADYGRYQPASQYQAPSQQSAAGYRPQQTTYAPAYQPVQNVQRAKTGKGATACAIIGAIGFFIIAILSIFRDISYVSEYKDYIITGDTVLYWGVLIVLGVMLCVHKKHIGFIIVSGLDAFLALYWMTLSDGYLNIIYFASSACMFALVLLNCVPALNKAAKITKFLWFIPGVLNLIACIIYTVNVVDSLKYYFEYYHYYKQIIDSFMEAIIMHFIESVTYTLFGLWLKASYAAEEKGKMQG